MIPRGNIESFELIFMSIGLTVVSLSYWPFSLFFLVVVGFVTLTTKSDPYLMIVFVGIIEILIVFLALTVARWKIGHIADRRLSL